MRRAAAAFARSMNSSTRWLLSRVWYGKTDTGDPVCWSSLNSSLAWSRRSAPPAKRRARIARAARFKSPTARATAPASQRDPCSAPASSIRTGPFPSSDAATASSSASTPEPPASRASITACAVP